MLLDQRSGTCCGIAYALVGTLRAATAAKILDDFFIVLLPVEKARKFANMIDCELPQLPIRMHFMTQTRVVERQISIN